MAETVKKSRIVSDEEENLEAALLEEFNTRLKHCMSKVCIFVGFIVDIETHFQIILKYQFRLL